MNLKYADEIYNFLATIPYGKVVTYGDIAEHLGNKKLARHVGNVLHANTDGDKYPCYKVVKCNGILASNYAFGGIKEQKKRLENEGIEVRGYKVDLNKYLY